MAASIKPELFKKDSGLPVPWRFTDRCPWDALNVGDSFFVPCQDIAEQSNRQSSAQSAARHRSIKLVTRRVKEGGKMGVRIWRIT